MRLRSLLTVEVFEKALTRRRRDGSVGRDNENNGLEKEGEEESKSASVGKVVGLISDDTNRILRMVRKFSLLILSTPDPTHFCRIGM